MMAQVNAGRVRFVGRGEYNNSTQYYVFDLVSYNGNSYYAKVDTIGNLPTNTTYWQLVAEKGNVGPTGPTGNGIASVTKTGTSSLVDTYTITFTNGNTTTFDVTNGKGISRIEKTATIDNVDTYTIYFNDNTTTTFEVANGEVTKEELEEEVDRLSMIYNLFPTTSDEDTKMTLNGTGEVTFKKFDLKGNTNQETTTGKNLLNTLYQHNVGDVVSSGGVDYTFNKDGSITINGTATSTSYALLYGNSLQDYQTQRFIVNGEYSVGSWGGDNIHLMCRDENANYKAIYKGEDYTGTDLKNISGLPIGVMYIQVITGSTINNVTIYPQIEIGSSKTSYEQYTGGISPNPNYPQNINVVTGEQNITISNKNKIKLTNGTYTSSGVTAVVNDGKITLNGTATNNSFITVGNVNLKASSYVLTINNNLTIGGTSSSSNYAAFRIMKENNIDFITTGAFFGVQNSSVNFSTQEEYSNCILVIRTAEGLTYNNFVIYPQLEEGQATSYVAHHEQNYTVNLGKNLFNLTNFSVSEGITATLENGEISLTWTQGFNLDLANVVYGLNNGVSYTISFKHKGNALYLRNKQVGSTNILQTNNDTDYTTYSITLNNITAFEFRFIRKDNTGTAYIKDIQLEKGSSASSFSLYKTPIELCKIGDYKDRIYKSNDKWYIEKKIGKVVLNGSEDYSIRNQGDGSTTITFNLSNFVIPNGINKYCNYFSYNQSSQDGVEGYGTSNNTIYFEIKRERLSSLDAISFKTWLSTHNTIVYYILSTPTTTEITDITLIEQLENLQKAYSYDTQTNISQTNTDMPFILDVEALMSLKNVLNT